MIKHFLARTPENSFAVDCGSQIGDAIDMTFLVDINSDTEVRLSGRTCSVTRSSATGFQVKAEFETIPEDLGVSPGCYTCVFNQGEGTVVFLS